MRRKGIGWAASRVVGMVLMLALLAIAATIMTTWRDAPIPALMDVRFALSDITGGRTR